MNQNKLLYKFGLMLVAVLFFAGSIMAQNIYVSSTGGDDGSGAGTNASPYATVAKALTVAAAGNTIYVADGTYANGVVTVAKDVTILGYSRNGSSDVNHPGFNINSDAVSLGTSGNKFNIGTLTLTKGVTTIATANVVLTAGATVTRVDGSITAAPTFPTNVNVTYTSANDVTAGPELPADLGTGTLFINPTATKTITVNSAVTAGVLTTAAGTTLDMGANLTVVGNITNPGVIKLNANKMIVDASAAAIAFSNAGDIISATAATVGTGVVEITGGHATNVYNVTYTGAGEVPNLTIASTFTESFVLGSAIDVYGNLVLESAATASFNFATFNVNLKGHFTRNEPTVGNVAVGATGTLTFNGIVDQTITPNANLTLMDVVVNNPGRTVNLVKSVTLTGNLTVTAGNLTVGDNNLFLTGAGKTFTNAGSFYSTTGVGHLIISGNTTLTGTGIFANIIIRNSAIVTAAAGNVNLAQTLQIEKGTFTPTGNVILNSTTYATYPKVVVWTDLGVIGAGNPFTTASSVLYDLEYYEAGATPAYAASHEWIGGSIRNLSVTSASGKTVNVTAPAELSTVAEVVTVTAGNTLTISANMTLAGNDKVHSVAGTIVGNIVANSLIVNGSGVTINGDAATTSTGASALPALTVNNAGTQTFTINNIRTIAGAFSYTGGVGNINFHDTYPGAFTTSFTQLAGTLNIKGAKDITVGTTATFTNGTTNLANSIKVTGAVTHSLGNIALTAGETFTFVNDYTHNNTGTFTGGRLIALIAAAQNLTLTTALTVPEFELAGSAAGDILTLVTNDLTVSDKLEFTQGVLALGNNNVVFNGTEVLFESTCPATPVTVGTGTIELKASPTLLLEQNITVPRLTVNTTGTVTLATDDVTAPITYRTLTVATDLIQTAGTIAIGGNSVALSANLSRTAGAWTATTGWLLWNGTAVEFDQGAGFSIPNLDVATDLTSEALVANKWSVTKNLKVGTFAAGAGNSTGAIVVTTADNLELADGITIERRAPIGATEAGFDQTPKFLGKVNVVYSGDIGAAYTPGKEWPANATTSILNSVTIASTVNALGVIPTAAQENEIISLLDLAGLYGQGLQTATLANGATLKLVAAANLAAPIAQVTDGIMHVEFANTAALTTTDNFMDIITTPAHTIGNVTLSGTADVIAHANGLYTFNGTVTFAGAASDYDIAAFATGIVVKGDVVQTAATSGFFLEDGAADLPLKFAGTADQAITLKSNIAFGAAPRRFAVETALTAGKKLTLAGANLDFATNDVSLTLTSGAIETTGTAAVVLKQKKHATLDQPVQGFTRTNGVIVGNVTKFIDVSATIANSRVEFPTGTLEGKFRGATVFFNTAPVNDFNLTVNHNDVAPTGSNGFPLDLKVAGDELITNYAPFNWLVTTDQTLTQGYEYELELSAEGYTDYIADGIEDIRLIRRVDGAETNNWILQGTVATNYDNFASAADFPVVKAGKATGGLQTQGVIFSYSQINKKPVVTTTGKVNSAAAAAIVNAAITVTELDTLVLAYTATDPDIGQTATLSVVSKPEAATYDAAKKELTWITTYADSGAHKVIVKADDGLMGVTMDTITVTVANKNRAPEFTAVANDTLLFADDAYTFTYAATDLDEDKLTYSLLESPDSMKIDASTGVVTWTVLAADEGKAFNLKVVVTDAFGLKDTSATAVLSVNLNAAPVFSKDVYQDTVYVGDETWGMDSIEVNVKATDVNMATAADVLTFAFVDPATAQGATITKLTDTTAVVKWKPGSVTGGITALFEIMVSDGELKDTAEVRIVVTDNTGITDLNEIPEVFSLRQNYPNPFNPTTKIEFGIPTASDVKVVVYNVLGQEVKELTNGALEAGTYSFSFDASDLPSGMYIYRIKAVADDASETFISTKKMMLVK